MYIQISLDNKFLAKLTIMNFQTKFAELGHCQSKFEIVNATMEFYMLEPVQVPSVSHYGSTFGTNLGTMAKSYMKVTKSTLLGQNNELTLGRRGQDNFWSSQQDHLSPSHQEKRWYVLDQICPKKAFMVENRKREEHHYILHI